MTLASLYLRLRFGMLVGEVRQELLAGEPVEAWGLVHAGWCVRMSKPGVFMEKVQASGRWGMEDLERTRQMAVADMLENEEWR